jgi:phosphate transport system substrate-binding protein
MRAALISILFSFAACGGNHYYIKIKGSDTELNLVVRMAEEFHKTYHGSDISVSGGGSGLGIAALLNGQTDIANSSRSMNAYEKTLFKKRNIEVDTFVFAEDAICFIVSAKLSLDSISLPDLAKIMSGERNNWIGLTGKNLPINIYGRQTNSGTHDFVKEKLGIEYSRYAKEMNGNAQIIEAIKADHSGIGYVGAGYVLNTAAGTQKIKVLKIVSGSPHYFQRPLYQFIRKGVHEKVAAFLAFEKSEQGLAIIRASGYIPAGSNY